MKSFATFMALTAVLFFLAGCSRMVKEEPYLTASNTQELTPVENLDLPRTTNSLEIPKVEAEGAAVAPDSRPPEMAFAKRRSEDENVVIIESGGMPIIEIFNDKDAWELMMGDHGYNWQLLDEDEENCQATYRFYDPIAEEVADTNFFKKLFQN